MKIRNCFLAAIAAAMLPAGMHAQEIPGTFASRPANGSTGKILTMEETILSRELYPQNERFRWEKEGKSYKAVKATGKAPLMARHRFEAFTEGNGLYLRDTLGNVTAIAEDCNRNIVYGQAVSRNEFGISGGIFWSPDRSLLAFYRKDESAVTDFPLLDIKSRTGKLMQIKYPMAGMASEVLRLCIYNVESGDTLHVKANDFGHDRYLTNVTWSPDSRNIFIQVVDRSQKHMKLNMYNASTGEFVKTVLSEDNDRYVEPLDPLYFIEGSKDSFIYRTANRDGYRSLYLCNTDGMQKRLTVTDADVAYIGNDGKDVYYTSAEVSPVENHLFKVNIKTGKKTRLTFAEGWHTVSLSPDFRQFIDHYSSISVPGVTDLCTTDGKKRSNLFTAEDPTLDYAYSEIRLGSVKSADGKYDNYYRVILPKDFDPSRKYPMVLYVYGGPHSQMVRNTYMAELRRWEMYMAQRGYIVYVQDNRGTQNRGLDFEQAIHGQCGQAEMADQIEGVRMMMSQPFVDSDHIAVHGWSYGGFMTISLIINYPDIFKVAVAGGPVIDWKWYEVMYGERYMDNPAVNREGYGKVSLINKAKDLKGKLLICQGAVDPVVVWQNSLSFVQECIDNNVQVDYFPYPTAEHNMFGMERVHLYNKVSEYIETYL
ncbi:MAG: S9 family peptidase [Bacteroides sp.]|nr:S9 family peptidase [Bacteroides sp.]